MSRLLSQDEIDALLASNAGGARTSGAADAVVYNFRRPDPISREQLRSLHLLHDRFALNVATSLSAFLRSVTRVSIVSVEQFVYSEFLVSLPDPTAFYAVSMHPTEGALGAVELNPTIAFTMVDLMLGGNGDTSAPERALTEIEQNVMDSVIKLLLECLNEAWKPITDMQFRIHGRETRPQMLQVSGPHETVVLLVFDVRVANTSGMLNICIPATAIEAVGEAFAQGWNRTRRQPTAEELAALHANLGRVPIPVTAQLQMTLPARDILALQPGDVISIAHAANQPVNVQVGQIPRFIGHLAMHHANTAVRIDSTIEDRQEPAA
jgi:flagellar motor switch protein FliM